ncbi:MAG TPA: hypothetical protein ENN80_09250, partial [Candidatus Hydrogenedentes bacterium]|nr:hypothetical protein [Candidatus Hydrogenedentota bacterium]
CPPIRNQDGCGSCWAFATTGVLECAIRIKDGINVDLSEQWLLNCNLDGYDCIDGGWWAHDYHMDTFDACGETGAVIEAACPYEAAVLPCDCPYPRAYWIDYWAYVGGEESIPPVESLKWAIMAFGPVAVGVTTSATFAGYHSGVYNNNVQGEITHAVLLVGWDDAQGVSGVWFLRNSWGSGWGEDGYMRIAYGCSSVGFGASVVDYGGDANGDGPTITRQPSGATVPQGFPHWFVAEATSAHGPVRYQWQRDGEDVSGQRPTGHFALGEVTPDDAGAYRCIVRDTQGATASHEVVLDVEPGEAPAGGYGALVLLGVLLGATGSAVSRGRRLSSRSAA